MKLLIKSYYRHFFNQFLPIPAGNVIGGGDWAKDRIVVDAWEQGKVEIRAQMRLDTRSRAFKRVFTFRQKLNSSVDSW